MPASTKDILKYWRASCVDSERSNIDPQKLTTYQGPRECIRKGVLPPYLAKTIWDSASEAGKIEGEGEKGFCQILISPLYLLQRPKSGKLRKNLPGSVTPIWIPANLFVDGRIEPRPDCFPWIPRDLLDPSHLACDIIVGSIASVDDYLTDCPFPSEWKDWDHVYKVAGDLFWSVSGSTMGSFEFKDYSTQDNSLIVIDDEFRGKAMHIIPLYDHLLGMGKYPALLSRFASLTDVLPSSLLGEREQVAMSARHLGQMNDKYGLMPSQREALSHFFAIKDGDLLAINGPPGTGKTTFIQSLVASLWVESALVGNEPPLILASSANNQAVRNIIDSFGKANEMDGPLSGRWVPGVTSYGLYLKSDSANGFDADKFQFANAKGEGFPSMIEAEADLEAAKEHFLECCRSYSGVPITELKQARQFLYDRLEAVSIAIKTGLDGWLHLLQKEDSIREKYGCHEGLEKYITDKGQEAKGFFTEAAHFSALLKEWHEYVDKEPFWMTLFSFLPPVRKRRALRYKLFLREQALDIIGDPLDVEAVSDTIIAGREQSQKLMQESIEEKSKAVTEQESFKESSSSHFQWRRDQKVNADPPEMLAQMDKALRYMAFKLATHYWEARWLQEMVEMVKKEDKDTESRVKKIRRLRRYAKLTPCMVSTVFMLPKFFSAYEGSPFPLLETIDLLIIDEAGQVSPEIAGAAFALAKKAVVVGDTLQIQPVWSIPERVDRGNVHGFISNDPEEAEKVYDRGITAFGGDVLTIARNTCEFGKPGEKGLYLVEHFRCVPEIIAYCNELAYNGRLIPMRSSIENHILPHMGWMNVDGQSEREGGSRINKCEAVAIVDWVNKMREEFEIYYKDDISAILGIVTPFSKQARLLRQLLAEKGMEKVTAGTVHALQGSERKIVLFSPVYGEEDSGPFFFDGNKNMLNVAVSRAMDSFIVIGSIAIFDKKRIERPSGLLAKYLFAEKNNEIKA